MVTRMNQESTRIKISKRATQAAHAAADVIVRAVGKRAREGRLCVVAFDITARPGTSAERVMHAPDSVDLVLEALAGMVDAGIVSLANMVACPVWERWPVPGGAEGNSARLREFLQTRTDICGSNIWNLEATDRDAIPGVCRSIGERIGALGGLDAIVLQVRPDERLGQNEIDAWATGRTRLVMTQDGKGFGRAITLGMADIAEAANVVVIGTGSACADAARWWELAAPMEESSDQWNIQLDSAAAAEHEAERFPWRLAPIAEAGLKWTPAVIARAGLSEADGEALSFDHCQELLATWGEVEPGQDPRPALRRVADQYLLTRAIPQGWKGVVLVARDGASPEHEIPGALKALQRQGVVMHTICLGSQEPAAGLQTIVKGEMLGHEIRERIAQSRASHVVVCDDASGPLSEIALKAAGRGVQVLCTRGVRSYQAEWFWPAARPIEHSPTDPGMGYLARLAGWNEGVECVGVVS